MNKYLIGAIVLLAGFLWFQQGRITRLKSDNERIDLNFKNSQFEIETYKTKDGKTASVIDQLRVSKDELEATNQSLAKTLTDMKLKIKNLESSTRIEYKYIVEKDTVWLEPQNPEDDGNYKYDAYFGDEYIDFKAVVALTSPQPYIENIRFTLTDSLTIANEFVTKQKWFLFIPCGKKVVGVKTHIKSENPYFKLDKVQTYQFDNRRNKKKFK